MKTLQSEDKFITVLINKNTQNLQADLINKDNLRPMVLFSDKNSKIENNKVSLDAEETIVIQWE
jgi:hypothetical protein